MWRNREWHRIFCVAALSASLMGAGEPKAGGGAGSASKPSKTSVHVAVAQQDPPLEKGAFSAKLDGSPVKVLRARGPVDDLILLLVLDLSGDPALVDVAREALAEQLPKLPRNHWVGVLKAQDSLQVLVDPTGDRAKVLDAIRAYPAVGKAGLLDTVESVAALGHRVMERTDVRVAVLFITDSDIYNYREDYTNPVINSSDSRDLSRRFGDQLIREKFQKIMDQLASYETPVSVVHLNYVSDPINEAYQRGLLQMSVETGGAGEFCRSRGEIAEAVGKAIDGAANHWSVAVELPKRLKQRMINVDVFNGDRDVPNRPRFTFGK